MVRRGWAAFQIWRGDRLMDKAAASYDDCMRLFGEARALQARGHTTINQIETGEKQDPPHDADWWRENSDLPF